MSIFYPSGCDDSVLTHVCNPCPESELGRVRGVAFVRNDFEFSNISLASEWEAGVAAKKIVIIPETRGTYDGGTTTFGPGFGDVPQKKQSKTFKVTFSDPNLKNNCDFYNGLSNSRKWRIAFISESLIQISDKAATVDPKDPIEEAVESERFWNVEATFVQKDNPCHFDKPEGIFTCFEDIEV